jgi:hypothetical protein
MKKLTIIFIFLSQLCNAQNRRADFGNIDWHVHSIEAPTPDSLARLLTVPYQTEMEKTRAIFSWIAQHVSYNTGIYNAGRKIAVRYIPDPYDTASSWKSATELTAEKVLRRRTAVCDGYAKLFKSLCDHAGINSVIITGYAKTYQEKKTRFLSNHSWNAVRIDSSWYLLDVTWASGYIDYADQYVQHLDEFYFLTPPAEFILNHYPEDLRWTLLEHPPALREFQFSPFKYKSFIKYSIQSYRPANGFIEASVGDTIQLELAIKDGARDVKIASDAFFDSTMLEFSPASVFLQPIVEADRIFYRFVVTNPELEWIHLIYNNDPILRYRLLLRKQTSVN